LLQFALCVFFPLKPQSSNETIFASGGDFSQLGYSPNRRWTRFGVFSEEANVHVEMERGEEVEKPGISKLASRSNHM
jgi:hypothetical protein